MNQTRPNILWIVTTQWRAQACGYAGDANARTPYLDALARESVNYAQAVTPHPFGPMARVALLTGVPSPENGVRGYFDALPNGARTIAHDLSERGYATAFFGKWGVGKRDPNLPLVGELAAKVVVPAEERGGFETWEGFEGGFLLNDPWWMSGKGGGFEQRKGYQSRVVCERVAQFMAEREPGERPWFGVASLEAPHPPYAAAADGVQAGDPREIGLAANVPRGGEGEAQARRELAGYYTHIEATDRAIGTVLLPKVKRGETIVVFTSVHGDMHGAHGLFRKGWPQEESVRVPLLVSGVGSTDRKSELRDGDSETGRVDDGAVSLVELPAMTRAWAERGEAVARREWSAISMPSVVALPHQCDRVWRGLRSKNRKLVLEESGEPWLFFDLENDPLEMKNLAGDPARRKEMEAVRAMMRGATSPRTI